MGNVLGNKKSNGEEYLTSAKPTQEDTVACIKKLMVDNKCTVDDDKLTACFDTVNDTATATAGQIGGADYINWQQRYRDYQNQTGGANPDSEQYTALSVSELDNMRSIMAQSGGAFPDMVSSATAMEPRINALQLLHTIGNQNGGEDDDDSSSSSDDTRSDYDYHLTSEGGASENVMPFYSSSSSTDYSFQRPLTRGRFD